MSAIRLFGGEPVQLTAGAVFDLVDTRLGGVLRCPDGVLGVFDCALDLPRADEHDVVGSEGTLHIPGPWLYTTGEIHLTRKGVTERIPADPDGTYGLTSSEENAYRIECDTFEQVVAGERPQPFGRPDAVAQAATLEAVLRAARTGQATVL